MNIGAWVWLAQEVRPSPGYFEERSAIPSWLQRDGTDPTADCCLPVAADFSDIVIAFHVVVIGAFCLCACANWLERKKEYDRLVNEAELPRTNDDNCMLECYGWLHEGPSKRNRTIECFATYMSRDPPEPNLVERFYGTLGARSGDDRGCASSVVRTDTSVHSIDRRDIESV